MNKISVLIPTYKPQAYIEKCLNSLQNQTLSKDKYCIYIALNGPQSFYEDYIKELLDNYTFQYEYIYLSEKGVSNARNNLINISKEPYITFIDDDDIVSENFLEELLINVTPQFMSISNVKSFKNNIEESNLNYIGDKFKLLNKTESSKFKSRQYYSSPWAKMLHRDMIGGIRFNTALSKGEDALFMAEISESIVGINKTDPSATYFVNERIGSVTRSKTNSLDEVRRITYLTFKYSKMLVHPNSDKIFIASRILATLKHLKRL